MIEGNDGGANVSFNGGAHLVDHLQPADRAVLPRHHRRPVPLPRLRRAAGQLAGPHAEPHRQRRHHERDWYAAGGGESGYIAPTPDDPTSSTPARLRRRHQPTRPPRTGQIRNVTVWPGQPDGGTAPSALKYRFQWTFPIVFSPHDPNTLYARGNVLFRSTDEGQSWEPISPDLTRNDTSKLGPSGGPITKDNTGVEYYCTIFAFAESPHEKRRLWAAPTTAWSTSRATAARPGRTSRRRTCPSGR